MADKNMKAKMNVEFTEATSRQSIESGDSVNTLFGKIKKFFSDLKSVAFSGSYNDLSDKPSIPTKTSQLTNDSGYKTTDNNTTYSLSKSGTDIILTGSDGSKTSVADTNTWRGIQDNLTSTSTTDSLSANQGKVLNEKIDGIQVGGRNLIIGSGTTGGNYIHNSGSISEMSYLGQKVVRTTGAWNGYFICIKNIADRINIKNGDTVTASIYVSTESETEVTHTLGLFRGRNINDSTKSFDNISLKRGSWVRISSTFTINDVTALVNSMRFECYDSTSYGILWACPKLELGNKATDWTPAPEDLAPADHTHSKVQDSNSGADTTFAYSKAGMNYADYSWLAGWNGSELRKIDKSQFAQASHTHSYAASSSAGGAANSANWLNINSSLTYGASGLQYFNQYVAATSGANINANPIANQWYHIIRMNHANNTGCYADIAVPLTIGADNVCWRRIDRGSETTWRTFLDSNNYKSYCTPANIGAANSSHTHSYLPLSGGTVTGNLTVNGTIKAKNIITGTKTLTLSSAVALATASLSSSDLGFTPTDNTSIIATIRKNISPTPLYLNIYTTIYNNTVCFCITNGAGSSNVPTGTYYIDYIITNNS